MTRTITNCEYIDCAGSWIYTDARYDYAFYMHFAGLPHYIISLKRI